MTMVLVWISKHGHKYVEEQQSSNLSNYQYSSWFREWEYEERWLSINDRGLDGIWKYLDNSLVIE